MEFHPPQADFPTVAASALAEHFHQPWPGCPHRTERCAAERDRFVSRERPRSSPWLGAPYPNPAATRRRIRPCLRCADGTRCRTGNGKDPPFFLLARFGQTGAGCADEALTQGGGERQHAGAVTHPN